ncbi:helix-turn-helix domain-containing protein [Hyphomonas sp. NPDC076900]|uniref:helix-turn-helix domain-containing protein n=1 Tax=unclassified Hyphomonas TaxID=2630699 RepID=UPI003D086663
MGKSLRSKAHVALIGELKKARLDAGLSQQQVAERLGQPQSYVAKIELGERRVDVVEFLQLTAVLGASWNAILKRVIAE